MGTDAVANLIREGKCYQIPSVLQSGAALGMHSLNADLARLVSLGRITRETAELRDRQERSAELFVIATEKGICRFDRYPFVLFLHFSLPFRQDLYQAAWHRGFHGGGVLGNGA